MRRVVSELDWDQALEPSVLRITRMQLEVLDCLVQSIAGAGHQVNEAHKIVADMWDVYAEMVDAARVMQVDAMNARPSKH